MSDTRIISQSDINALERAVDRLNDVARSMRGVVHTVSATAADLDDSIDTIKAEFDAFREFDTEQKELAIAKTRIVDVRQQLKEKFGINDDVRQYLTGILEASDLTLVRERIITNCTERIMISCPEYWLAPCLVAISASRLHRNRLSIAPLSRRDPVFSSDASRIQPRPTGNTYRLSAAPAQPSTRYT